jgi:prepilin-type N-terminal cleavage/methylation domain-containing protein
MKRHLSSGFTLIELLVVIAIIGLLATFAVVQLSGSKEKARVAKGAAFSGQILRSTGDDLIGRWDFDECNGAIVDSSGYGNNGALASGVTFSSNTPSGQGCSLAFNGSGNIVISNSSLGPQQTKTMWAYLGTTAGNQYLIDEGINNNFIHILSGTIGAGTVGTAGNYFYGTSNILPNKWYFFAVTYNGSTFSIYVDGALDKARSGVASQAPTASITLGSYGGGTGKLTGSLDEVHIFNRSLNSEEIHHMYAEGLLRHLAQE